MFCTNCGQGNADDVKFCTSCGATIGDSVAPKPEAPPEAQTAKKLDVAATLKEGIEIGVKNIGPILVNVVLWVLTVWIPYLNVGTTIGLMVGIVSKASKGKPISFTEIFESKYRQYMGEFFLTFGLIGIGVYVGIIFFIIPGFIIGLAWSLALLLVIDKGKNPAEALVISNNCTFGYKARMCGIYILASVVFLVGQIILIAIGVLSGSDGLLGFMGFIVFLSIFFEIFVFIGLQSSIYKQLTGDV